MRLLLLGFLTATTLASQTHLAAEDGSEVRDNEADEFQRDQLENQLKGFWHSKRKSLEDQILRLIEDSQPNVEEVQKTLPDVHRSGHATDLKQGISHNHTFEVDGLTISTSLFVPVALKTPAALWVIPAHPLHKANSDKHFEFMLPALPKDAMVLWVHLIDEAHSNPDGLLAKKYSRRYDRLKIVNHSDAFAAAVAMALERFPVDSDRVYCWGVSASGIATWWNGIGLPDVFAGICCCDTNPLHVIPWMSSLQAMRVGILHGEKDDRCPVRFARRADDALKRIGVSHRYVEVAGGRHGVTWHQHAPELCDWVAEHTREASPLKLTFYPDRNGDRRFWVEALELDVPPIEQQPAFGPSLSKVQAEILGNGTIDIKTRGVTRLRVWLDKNTASIRVNQTDINKKPKVLLSESLRHAKKRRDPKLFKAWAVEVKVPVDGAN